ncbi:MAG TPA: hypothetical protein VEB18_01890 [Candidatus Paceibacterota bacterium]|nr:hypothetical protein [Candidatus Paceibacterota bacterium]
MLRLLLAVLFPPRDTERLVLDSSYDAVAKLVAPRTIGTVTALLPYRNPLVHALIKEAKYKGNERAQELLGRVLAEYLQEFLAEEALVGHTSHTLVPIPLSEMRYRERGYNQVARILENTRRLLPLPLDEAVLVRTRDTASQTSLSRRRRLQNVRGAFTQIKTADETTYLLIDDVVTTGATLQEGASTLVGARVLPIALAY